MATDGEEDKEMTAERVCAVLNKCEHTLDLIRQQTELLGELRASTLVQWSGEEDKYMELCRRVHMCTGGGDPMKLRHAQFALRRFVDTLEEKAREEAEDAKDAG